MCAIWKKGYNFDAVVQAYCDGRMESRRNKSIFFQSESLYTMSNLKRGYIALLLLVSGFLHTAHAQSTPFNVMTFNIRMPNPNDGFNYWPNRKDLVVSMIRFHEVDLLGVQEAFRSQLDELSAGLPGFAWTGVCRTDGTKTPKPDDEFSAIFYRTDRFELLESQTYWLSETPEKAGVKGWDAALPRIVTWAKFKDKSSGVVFYHFNTHFDHIGQVARAKSAHLILERTQAIAGTAPVLVTGDFNAQPTDAPVRILTDTNDPLHLKDAIQLSELPHHGSTGTWTNAFLFPGLPGHRIDYIFLKNDVRVLKHAILSDSWSGRLPSDHLPVWARVALTP